MKKTEKLILLLFVVFVSSCQQTGDKTGENKEEQVNSDVGFESEELNKVYHRFPSPEEMMSILESANLQYEGDLVNEASKSKEYLNSRAQALNLGVYSADLAYLTLFDKHKEASPYFESLYKLSDELKIASAFDAKLLIRIQSNLNNSDTLKVLMNQAFTSISDFLVANDKERIFAIISIGGFVEALYLSFNLAGDFSEDNVIIQRIADQKLVLENIINYSTRFKDDPALAGALRIIEPIVQMYQEISETPVETKITKSEDGKIIISGGNKITITEEQYNKLKEATLSSRKMITQN